MYNVVILGSENSHARDFCSFMNGGSALLSNIPCADFKVIGVCGDSAEENKYLCETYGVAEVSENGDEWLDRADAVMVTARHGGKHLAYAKKYIERGIPAFIDKPFTVSEEDALELARIAKANGTPLCGGSMLGAVTDTLVMKNVMQSGNLGKIYGGAISAPVSMKNEWGDFFFYSQHLVQMMVAVFGNDVKSVSAVSRDDSATFVARYKDFDVTGHYGSTKFTITIYGHTGVEHRNVNLDDGALREFYTFTNMVRSGKMAGTYEDLVAPVFVLNAIYRSIKSGKEEKVNEFVI